MPITEATLASTAEILRLVGFNKQRLSQLTQQGVVTPVDTNSWRLIETINKLFNEARGAKRDEHAAKRSMLLDQQARLTQMRMDREAGKLIDAREFHEAVRIIAGAVTAELVSIPSRITRDVVLRRAIEVQLDRARHRMCDVIEAEAARLEVANPSPLEAAPS